MALNDADATGTREGILTYSPFNEDRSYADVSRWTHTWIGSLWEPVGVEDELTADSYALAQNYPNPFNPATTIKYSIQKAGLVTLRVYDMLGREVATLVDQEQNAGVYSVQFNASGLASGIYLYKLESGSFTKTNKLMLIK
ncbi:MAG: T9SS type A sorting domain-containing protein [Ignavibacteriales bacterium]|nr:MAG: T9SS type A sorting domain-containing protein [Ignavibacteriales bacterium]